MRERPNLQKPTLYELVKCKHKHQEAIATAIYRRLLKRDPCVYCGQPYDKSANRNSAWYITVDHIIPRIKGGLSHWTNYAPTCQHCNNFKGQRHLLELLLIANTPPH